MKYSPPGSPVMVRAGHDGGAIVLGVEDRGHGLDACEREHVFEPFYRAEGVRRIGPKGAGLGLAVARRIAEALEGTLTSKACREAGTGSSSGLRRADRGRTGMARHQHRAAAEEKSPGLPARPGHRLKGCIDADHE